MARSARDESERETRRTRIDPKLIAQGWNILPFDPSCGLERYTRHAVTESPTADGPASVLLERIRAERESVDNGKPKRKAPRRTPAASAPKQQPAPRKSKPRRKK